MLKCKRCSYGWESRVGLPKECPQCHSRLWNKERRDKEEVAVEDVVFEDVERGGVNPALAGLPTGLKKGRAR